MQEVVPARIYTSVQSPLPQFLGGRWTSSKYQIVHLPELSLNARAYGRRGCRESAGMNPLKRKMSKPNPQDAAVDIFARQGRIDLGGKLGTVLTLKIREHD
jgi:hypothetical protein